MNVYQEAAALGVDSSTVNELLNGGVDYSQPKVKRSSGPPEFFHELQGVAEEALTSAERLAPFRPLGSFEAGLYSSVALDAMWPLIEEAIQAAQETA